MIKSFDGQGFTPRVLCEMRFSAGSKNALRLLPTLERIHVTGDANPVTNGFAIILL
jgi:hypothetical protein